MKPTRNPPLRDIPYLDAVATALFAACFCVFDGNIYISKKPAEINDGWIRYVETIQ